MDATRLNTGEKLAGAAAVVLFITMFLNWFGAPDIGGVDFEGLTGVDVSISAWQAFDFIDLLLLLTVISGVALAVTAAVASAPNMPVALSAITTGIAAISTLFVLYRVIDPPFSLDREYGLFIGLIAVALVAVGGWMSMQEEGTTFGGEADRLQSRDTATGGPTDTGGSAPPPPPPPSDPPRAPRA